MMNINFSEKLKQLRKNKGITQQALANAIGEKRSSIANYESNNSTPGFEILNKLSNYFNVPVGYLTGKTNSLVSEYSFKTLEDYINILPNQKPLWLKIKNPIKYSSFSGDEVYGPNQNSKIVFFNPLDEKEKNSRIYLEFLAINSYAGNREKFYKALYDFACKYGFFGEVFESTNENFNYSFPIFKPFEIGIFDTVYYNPSLFQFDLNFKTVDLPGKDKFKPILEKHKITGYFEPISCYMDYLSEMHRLLYNLSCDNSLLEKTLEQISYRTGGIRKRFVKTDTDEIVESISYKSLLSLMYYELFLDIKNGNIPNYCFDCQKFYLPDSKHKCKK